MQESLSSESKDEPLDTFNQAMTKALDWLRERDVVLEEVYRSEKVSKDVTTENYGMQSRDTSGGYRIEFHNVKMTTGVARAVAHINVWAPKSHGESKRHFCFHGNEQSVKTLWAVLFKWDPRIQNKNA
jgi:hypothetical protein